MLKQLQSHQQYLEKQQELLQWVPKDARLEYQELIALFKHLNFDPVHPILSERYSHTGRPALAQIEILRMYVLAAFLSLSLERLFYKLEKKAVFLAIIGIEKEHLPTLPSFYELSQRLMPTGEKATLRYKRDKNPKKKYKKNQKMPEKKQNRTAKLAVIIRKGNFMLQRPERFLQTLFKLVSLDSSRKIGLLSDSLYVSGDGTCLKTGASSYGRKICSCRKQGLFSCDCPRRYSDPKATFVWDSSKEQYFYGYTTYFLSTYNESLTLDLPLYVRTVEAAVMTVFLRLSL